MSETSKLPTFRETREGGRLVTILPDFGGSDVFAFWIEDCFDPPVYMVRGEDMDDAYDTFLASPAPALQHYILRADDPYLGNYIEGWDAGPLMRTATLEDVGEAWANGRTSGIGVNDNGDLVVTEAIRGCRWEDRPWR